MSDRSTSEQGISMRTRLAIKATITLLTAFIAAPSAAADGPQPKEGDWIVHDFRFHTGETLPDLRLHYATLGAPTGEPVIVLHGTGQSGSVMLAVPFAGDLFGPGQPLDLARYYVILPDAIGHGKSSKPSDGLRTAFPKYDYDDIVDAEYRLVVEHLGVKHARLVLGNSMGGMETWLFAQKHPGFMDVAVPMASMPTPMSGRNWMMRRLIVDSIRNDPEWMNGNYTKQPNSARFAFTFYNVAMNGGSQAIQKAAPTRAKADALVEQRLAAPAQDANDMLYQWEASGDFDPSGGLERITAQVLVINSADDERNPPDLGIVDREMKRVRNGRVLLIPASDATAGHGTTFQAKYWKNDVDDLLRTAPRLSN
jgi:homoserine O-acetyltransferase/O-succinyltransferase